jgi:hypothetical protein
MPILAERSCAISEAVISSPGCQNAAAAHAIESKRYILQECVAGPAFELMGLRLMALRYDTSEYASFLQAFNIPPAVKPPSTSSVVPVM